MNTDRPLLAGVVGWPIGHSRSPRLHGHWLDRYGIDGYYIPIALEPEDFEAGLRALPRLGFRGVNVTIPHKETACALADARSPRADAIGAANTLSFGAEGEIHADNTDGYGFLENLRQGAPGWRADAGPALVLGAGGAARGVVWALLEAGAPEVRLANRTRARADALRSEFGARVVALDWAEAEAAAAGATAIVNTTALGLAVEDVAPLDFRNADAQALATDIVYEPLETPFLAAARRRGLRTVDGLGMLLHQAAPGFEAWFGVRPEVDDALRAAVLAR